MEEDIKKMSNDELLTAIQNISTNHEKIKQEMITLHNVLEALENDYVTLANELKNRV